MKCMRCGKGIGITRRGQAIADGYVCYSCLDELGFGKSERGVTRWAYSFDEIKNGKDAMLSKAPCPSVKIADYGQERDLSFTDKEREIYDIVRSLCDDVNLESDNLSFTHKSDDYASIVMESSSGYGSMDVMRVKFTDRAKWIKVGPDFKKIAISDPEDVTRYAGQIYEAYRFNEPYL